MDKKLKPKMPEFVQPKPCFNFKTGQKYFIADSIHSKDKEFKTFFYCGQIGQLHSFKHPAGWYVDFSNQQLIGKIIKEV